MNQGELTRPSYKWTHKLRAMNWAHDIVVKQRAHRRQKAIFKAKSPAKIWQDLRKISEMKTFMIESWNFKYWSQANIPACKLTTFVSSFTTSANGQSFANCHVIMPRLPRPCTKLGQWKEQFLTVYIAVDGMALVPWNLQQWPLPKRRNCTVYHVMVSCGHFPYWTVFGGTERLFVTMSEFDGDQNHQVWM